MPKNNNNLGNRINTIKTFSSNRNFFIKKINEKIIYLSKILPRLYIKTITKKIIILLNVFNQRKIQKTSIGLSNLFICS